MAKRSNNPERLIYCSGPSWEGDGSKVSSPCQFGASLTTVANRFKCHYCAVGMTPSDIYADENGVVEKRKELIMSNAPKNDDEQVEEIEPEIEIKIEPESEPEPPTRSILPDPTEETVEIPETPAKRTKTKKSIKKKHRRW